MRVLLRKSPLCRKHFFEWLKTTVLLFDCGTSTLKSLLLLGSNAPHVHLRLRKRFSRCTLDCGFKTSESPALRGFVAERGPVRGPSLYLYQNRTASTVQKSGLKSSTFRPKPFPHISSKSYRHNAVPNHFSSQFSTSRTNGPRLLSRVKAGTHGFSEKDRTQGHTRRNTGVSDGGGITTLGAFCAVRKPCAAGYQNGVLCRFGGLVGGTPEERRKPAGQRCAYARRCPEASRPRWAAQRCCSCFDLL